jgi:hypothetical protein
MTVEKSTLSKHFLAVTLLGLFRRPAALRPPVACLVDRRVIVRQFAPNLAIPRSARLAIIRGLNSILRASAHKECKKTLDALASAFPCPHRVGVNHLRIDSHRQLTRIDR